MGDRGQVLIKDEKVYLYTHWGASDMEADVKRAMAKQWRWDDPEYLGRIIFDEMVHTHNTETGYGIGTTEHGDIELLITIDCHKSLITISKKYYKEKSDKTISFNDFIK